MSDITSASLPALAICLEGYEYPYPVSFLPLSNDLHPDQFLAELLPFPAS